MSQNSLTRVEVISFMRLDAPQHAGRSNVRGILILQAVHRFELIDFIKIERNKICISSIYMHSVYT